MLADIVIFLKQQGAKNPQSWVEGEEDPPKPKMLTLECSECWEPGRPTAGSKRAHRTWEAPAFTACPNCGSRETVGKITMPPPPNPPTTATLLSSDGSVVRQGTT